MENLAATLNILSAIAALTAAGLWWWASHAIVPSDYAEPVADGARYVAFHGRQPVGITPSGKRYEFLETLELQGRLNTYAAATAAAAALLQGLALGVPLLASLAQR